MTLVRVQQCVEYLLGHMNRISDNDNLGNVFLGTDLVDAIPNHEKFCFSSCNEGHIV